MESDYPLGFPCKPHGNKAELVCENTLPSGLSCPYSVCDECWDYNEGNEDILPTRTSIFCFDCINSLKAKYRKEVMPPLAGLANNNQSQNTASHNPVTQVESYISNVPIISTEKNMIDLSQLSSSPFTPHNMENDDNHLKKQTPCSLQPRRLFSSINMVKGNTKSVSFCNDDKSCPCDSHRVLSRWKNHHQISENTVDLSDENLIDDVMHQRIEDPNPISETIDVDIERQIACSGYKDKPSVVGGIDQEEEYLVQDDTVLATDNNVTTATSRIRNPYNNVASSTALNATPYELEESHPIHVPDWYLNMIVSNDMVEETAKKMTSKNWITHDLQAEIESNYPAVDEIHIDLVTGICKRDLDAFKRKCELMFPKGRIFMSSTQLDQAAKYFLDGWNVKKVHNAKKILCFYGISRKKNYVSTCDPSKRRKVDTSLKEQYQCPFKIQYSHIGISNKMKKPRIFYHVKITNLNASHTCELSTQCFRNATSSSRGKVKLSLTGMNSLLQILKVSPSTPALVLRPLLQQFVNSDTVIDCNFIRNFRTRAALYHSTLSSSTDYSPEISLDVANHMLSSKNISSEEESVLDNPLIRINFNEVIRKITAQDSTTWEAYAFMKECKKTMPGFDYRIRLDKNNKRPIAMVFMTADNRKIF